MQRNLGLPRLSEIRCALNPKFLRADAVLGTVAAESHPEPSPARLHIVGVDPNAEMLRLAAMAARVAGVGVTTGDGSCSSISSYRDEGIEASPSDGGDIGRVAAAAEASELGFSAPRQDMELSLISAGVEALPFPDGEFDAAVVTLVSNMINISSMKPPNPFLSFAAARSLAGYNSPLPLPLPTVAWEATKQRAGARSLPVGHGGGAGVVRATE